MTGGDRPKRVAIYARVSTAEQSCDAQLLDLRRYAAERGWTVQGEYVDRGVSGAKESRPELDRMMDACRKRGADVVLVWRFDRLARSVKHLVLTMDELRRLGIEFVSYQENVDTDSPLGRAIFAIVAAMAELERNIIVERIQGGLRRARAEGKRLGRPPVSVDAGRVLAMRAEGFSIRRIARRLGVSKSKIGEILQSRAPQHASAPAVQSAQERETGVDRAEHGTFTLETAPRTQR
ncbi:MAG: recombinase family protein [Planctomycetota bacterium]|nr:recombinase family protein [Planctomycetota bacterium]